MKLDRIVSLLNREVWAISPARHAAIRQVIAAHLQGNGLPFDPTAEEATPAVTIIGKVAVLPIEGTMLPKASGLEAACGVFSCQNFRNNIKSVAANPKVESIVLDIASGGGAVAGVAEACDLVASVANIKEVISYTSDVAASAAYWLGSQANQFYMSKSAEVGSIGVYHAYLDVTRAMEMQGVKLDLFKAGEFKAMGMAGKPLTDGERELIQASVDKSYKSMTDYISAKRPNVKKATMQGQMFDLEDAMKAGLIDGQIDDIQDLIAFLNK